MSDANPSLKPKNTPYQLALVDGLAFVFFSRRLGRAERRRASSSPILSRPPDVLCRCLMIGLGRDVDCLSYSCCAGCFRCRSARPADEIV